MKKKLFLDDIRAIDMVYSKSIKSEFNLDKEVIVDFCSFAVQFFENV